VKSLEPGGGRKNTTSTKGRRCLVSTSREESRILEKEGSCVLCEVPKTDKQTKRPQWPGRGLGRGTRDRGKPVECRKMGGSKTFQITRGERAIMGGKVWAEREKNYFASV